MAADILLSLPPNLVNHFHTVAGVSPDEYFCTSDPAGHRVGSGGGTAWLLEECARAEAPEAGFSEWLGRNRRILVHAGGQSRRLPSYAPSGKVLTPIPIFRWERGQKLSQTLLDLQLPLYRRIMEQAPEGMNTMVVSGDVYIRAAEMLPPVPKADVVCYGLWLDATIASNHGVFYSTHADPSRLHHMLQKPTAATLASLLQSGYYLTDIGIWLLSDRAVELLRRRCRADGSDSGEIREYDLYSDFGRALGTSPEVVDADLNALTVAIVPLPGGEFYHYGTSRELISSTLRVQNLVNDQRSILHRDRKPAPSMFVQNARLGFPLNPENRNIWIENCDLGPGWKLASDHILTGIPAGTECAPELKPGDCVDVVPVGETSYAVRVYRMDDRFAGAEQTSPRFPVVGSVAEIGPAITAQLAGESLDSYPELISAEHISDIARLDRLDAARRTLRRANREALAANHRHSVFYQSDLCEAAAEYAEGNIPLPPSLEESEPAMKRMSDSMFRAEVLRRRGDAEFSIHEERSFNLLRQQLTSAALADRQHPHRAVCADQIVWSRSPVRIDIAGGWTDTPPYCLLEGGAVVNFAIELNGQPPLQAYIRPCRENQIVCRSIDLGAEERIETFEQILDFHRVGSPFSIPKAALALAGLHPQFCSTAYPSLKAQLSECFGGGFEITLFSAIPAGSGLGTSSILAATVLGAVSDFCSLGWDKNEICRRTLVLEQLLTTGGGWQDQLGGVHGGVKLLQTSPGIDQDPRIHWLPDTLFTDPQYAACQLLFYTGITRTAKDILAEIVRRMFLNHGPQLRQLRAMKAHALDMREAVQRCEFERMGDLVRRTWKQNQSLDSGTNPPEVQAVTRLIDDLCLGYKLPGAGGGGYLYMIAKDPEAAARIKQILTTSPGLRPNSRMVGMALSRTGLAVTRS